MSFLFILAEAASASPSPLPVIEPFWSTLPSKVAISILSSAFTLFLVTIGKSLWDTRIYPFWLRYFRHNDQNVEGTWIHQYEADATNQKASDRLTLRQHGHLLSGDFEYTLTNIDGTTDVHHYYLKGELKNDVVVMYYVTRNRRNKGIGVLALKIVDNGRRLKGNGVFHVSNLDQLDPQECEYVQLSDPTSKKA